MQKPNKRICKRLEQEFQELAGQLTLLRPANLSGEEIYFCKNVPIPSEEFSKRMPLTVAHFTVDAEAEIYNQAIGQPDAQDLIHLGGLSYKVETQFKQDANIISRYLFNGYVVDVDSQAGNFKAERFPELHTDNSISDIIAFASRLFALPTQLVSGATYDAADEKLLAKIETAKENNHAGKAARKELHQEDLLKDVELGALISIALGSNTKKFIGTYHCSSPVPPEGAVSAFLRAWVKRADNP